METINYPLQYQRLKTREVSIGPLKIGADHPICIQSMLTTSVQKSEACLDEIMSLAAVDCQLIRITIPTGKDLDAAERLCHILTEEGITIPLVADIHFSPKLAVDACELFEKVRINPGNYSDSPKRTKEARGNTFYEEGRERLKEAIVPLAKKLIKLKRALRIGVNQGSLSTRMMERYGDTPQGMVYSALELVELFEELGFDQLVISLKSSNPVIVQKAYRFLVEQQRNREAIPLHLGVTEAGNGLMGRIKSLAGIGGLLKDGIGDTIRISLTEASANEVIFAREFLGEIQKEMTASKNADSWGRPLNHQRAKNKAIRTNDLVLGEGSELKIGFPSETAISRAPFEFEPDFNYIKTKEAFHIDNIPISKSGTTLKMSESEGAIVFPPGTSLFILRRSYQVAQGRKNGPVGLVYMSHPDYNREVDISGMLVEGLLDFILIPEDITAENLERLLYILQATRTRIFITDYIICPSCGRTLFDIQEVAEKIREKTSHLKGLKIGIMGCIVNGPGEMADADFGYVGSGTGKVDLYFGQEKIRRGVAEKDAVEELIHLIKEKGYWR